MRAAYPLLCLVLPVLVAGNIIGNRREKNVRRHIYQPNDGLDQYLQMKMQWIRNQIQDRIQHRRHHQTIPQQQNNWPEDLYRPNKDVYQYGEPSLIGHHSEEKNSKERNTEESNSMTHQSKEWNSKELNSMGHNSMKQNSKEHTSSEHNSMESNSKQRNSNENNSKQRNSNESNSKENKSKEYNSKESNSKEHNAKESNSKENNSKQRNSNENNSKQRNSNESNSKENNSKEYNSKESNSKEHNSNEYDSKEKNSSKEKSSKETSNNQEYGRKSKRIRVQTQVSTSDSSESRESISNLSPKVPHIITQERLLREKKPQSYYASLPQTQVSSLNRIDSSESQESAKLLRGPEHIKVGGKHYNVMDSQEDRNEPSVSWQGKDRFGENRRTGRNWPLFTALSSLVYPGSINDAVSWYDVHSSDAQDPITQYMTDLEDSVKAAYDHFKPKDALEKNRFHVLYESAVHLNDPNMYRNATELLQANNYPVEEHNVKTEDGYILTVFHIPPKTENYETDRKVVFLMHGLLESADSWLLQGPGKSLPYLLADAGYDVWLGNVRGSKYGRRHVTKQPEEQTFWQFTNDEIALRDLPAMIDYVLANTQQQKMYYVGHSQGTTTFFALAASKPEYNSKIEAMHALSPMVYMTYTRNPVFRMLSPDSPTFNSMYDSLGRGEFKPSSELIEAFGGNWCQDIIGCKNICANLNFVMSGVNEQRLNSSQTAVFTHHLPAGSSVRVIKHYAQWISSHEFRKYNYGSSNNQQLYESAHPPKYDLGQVTAPVSLYYSDDDWLAQPGDVQKLKSELPSVKNVYKVLRPFTHLDYQFSKDARKLVYDKLIASLKQN